MTLRRLEDERLVTGRGQYVDDLRMEGMLHAVFVRSSEAHALVTGIDCEAARAMPGVVGVFDAPALGLERPMPNLFPAPLLAGSVQASPLATEEVCHVGEPLVVVVADTRARAVDAAAEVDVSYRPLPAMVDVAHALDEEAPAVHRSLDSNLVASLEASFGDVEGAFGAHGGRAEVHLRLHRGAVASIETRGVVAAPGTDGGDLQVWSSTQSPHSVRASLAAYFDLAPAGVRVIAPDVGGGFGPKAGVYAEEYVLAALARRLGRPVKWIETRREHFTTTFQQRDQVVHLEAAFTHTGELLGIRGRIIHDNGAYVPYGLVLPQTGLRLMAGPYRLPALDVRIDVAYTNLAPTSPVRGAGRPYAVFAIERLMDAVARRLGMDPAEVRRRNFVPPDGFPHTVQIASRDGGWIEYDEGDYAKTLELALERADVAGFPQRKAADAALGRLRGIGLASYVEDTGLGPAESVRVEVLESGEVLVDTGVAAQGQGHATVFAQLCAEELGLPTEAVRVRAGDTGLHPEGGPTVASRTAVTAAPSVRLAAGQVAELARRLAAEHLEAAPEDMVLEDGWVKVRGQPGAQVSLAELVLMARAQGGELAEVASFPFDRASFAFGTHVAEVTVDPETGVVEVERYVVAHDCGRILNRMIVDGQIDGGVAHGLGNALSERLAFSPEGQPLVTTFMDYRIPSAASMPVLVKVHTETPSPRNPLGAKGAGEGGTIPAAAAVAAALDDALAGLGVVADRHPLTPEFVRRLIVEAGEGHPSRG